MFNPPTWSVKQKLTQTKYKPRMHSQNNQTAEGQTIWNTHITAGRACLQPACRGEEEWFLPAWTQWESSQTLVLLEITGMTRREEAHNLHSCWLAFLCLAGASSDGSLALFLPAHTWMSLQFVGWVRGVREGRLCGTQQAYTWDRWTKALKNFKVYVEFLLLNVWSLLILLS